VGAPRYEVRTSSEYVPQARSIWASSAKPKFGVHAEPIAFAPDAATTTRPPPTMRQAAYMEPNLRSTYKPAVPRDAWPWPLAQPTAPPTRHDVERTIFQSHRTAARSAAAKAAASTLPEGSADQSMLHDSIYAQMKREAPAPRTVPLPHRAAPRRPGTWVTPGATPMQPTPRHH
jgi:hypothetical protein